ncbi:hypothetical protein KA089_00175 [Candidatus Woesebacteria bacterium]|nr:hypothetical protein [Candidatus Woesebacteria bacterium]
MKKPNDRKSSVTLFISNMTEDVWDFVQSFNDYKMKANEVQENARLSDQHLHGVADEKELIFISPYNLDKEYLKYIDSLYSFSRLTTLSPQKHSGEICIDLIKDEATYAILLEELRHYKTVVFKSYSSSHQFYVLKKKLIADGINLTTPEAPDDSSAWTVNFFGSKSGIRQLAQKTMTEEPDFRVADGLICMGLNEVSQMAAHRYIKEDGVVLKTNKGHSGAGVLIFKEGDLSDDFDTCQKQIYKILKQDSYWSNFPTVVEDLVNINPKISGGFPNTEYIIKGNGEIELLYFGGLIVTKKGVYKGMEIGKDVVSERVMVGLIDFGYFIGEQYSKSGYRGFYDVDMIAAKNGKVFVSESNTRRTGATHVYKSVSKLLGKDFMDDYYVISQNSHAMKPNASPINFSQILELTKDLQFAKGKKKGVVFTSANILHQQSVGYIVFAEEKKEALAIRDELAKRLKLS